MQDVLFLPDQICFRLHVSPPLLTTVSFKGPKNGRRHRLAKFLLRDAVLRSPRNLSDATTAKKRC